MSATCRARLTGSRLRKRFIRGLLGISKARLGRGLRSCRLRLRDGRREPSAAKAVTENKAFSAAVNRCAAQNKTLRPNFARLGGPGAAVPTRNFLPLRSRSHQV